MVHERTRKYAGWGGHALLGRMAFDTLPEWEQAIMRPDMRAAALRKPYLSDLVQTVGDKVGFLCGILDMVYDDECRPFATLPDGRWIPHSAPDALGQSSAGSGLPRSPAVGLEITEWLLNRMVGAIRADHWEEAVRHGGALGHFLQEPFTPGHAIDNTLFQQFFADPDPDRHMRLHHAFDAASAGFEPLPPVLMGTTVAEAAFRLQLEIERGIRDGLPLVPALVRSVYEGEPADVRRAILAPQCRKAVFATASAWHSAIAIAMDRFEADEVRRLERLPLTDVVPFFVHHWQYVDVVPGCLVRAMRKIPIHVWEPAPGGGKREVRVEDGFGMGGHMGFKFYVNGDVYTRFRCRVGLPSRHTEGQTEHTNTRFFVETDPGYNTTYSEDIEYGAQTRAEVPMDPGEPVCDIDVNLKGARTLILRAKSESYTDAGGAVRFSVPHVAVCDPVLLKT